MLRHPSKQELMAYAEGQVDALATFSESIGQHLRVCEACSAEVAAMRDSLSATAALSPLEPSSGLTERILVAARAERVTQRAARRPLGDSLLSAAKGMAYAALLAVVAAGSFRAALLQKEPLRATAPVVQTAAQRTAAAGASQETFQKTTAEVRALASALSSNKDALRSYPDQAQLRAVLFLDADIREALAALERFPGCERAERLVSANRQRQAQALRQLYVDRNL